MDEWAQCKNHGNHVNQRKLHMVHTLIFGKSTTDAHGHTRVKKKLICELFLEIIRSYLDKFLFFYAHNLKGLTVKDLKCPLLLAYFFVVENSSKLFVKIGFEVENLCKICCHV